MNVELTRFKVKEGKTEKVDEWLQFLKANMKDVLITLENEKMFVETIFRETLNGSEYLYWYSVQGPNGQDVESSEHWIDKKHLQYWDECIDPTFTAFDLTTEVVMIPDKIKTVMEKSYME